MTKMTELQIELAQTTAELTMVVNGLDSSSDSAMEDALCRMVLALVGHIQTQDKEDFEYAQQQVRNGVPQEILPSEWTDSREDAEGDVKFYNERWANEDKIEAVLVRRRKAGEVERLLGDL